RVGRGHALHGRVQPGEVLAGDLRRDLGAVAPGERVFVGDEHAAGLAHGFPDDLPVHRRQAAQIDDLDAHAVLLLQLLGRHQGAGLRVVDGTALQVSAVGDADDGGGAERVVGAPAHRGELVAKLVIGGPDVVEELDLDDRLEPAGGEPDRPTHDVGLGQGRVVDAPAA